jgi:hypothetical protein
MPLSFSRSLMAFSRTCCNVLYLCVFRVSRTLLMSLEYHRLGTSRKSLKNESPQRRRKTGSLPRHGWPRLLPGSFASFPRITQYTYNLVMNTAHTSSCIPCSCLSISNYCLLAVLLGLFTHTRILRLCNDCNSNRICYTMQMHSLLIHLR